jgi:hypothetical protein
VEPVAHRLPRQAGGSAGVHRLLGELQPLLGGAAGGVERDQPVGDLGPLLGEPRGDVGGERRLPGLRQRLGHRGEPGGGRGALDRGERLRIVARQHRDDARGQRPLAILELREVADRQPQPRRHRALVEPGGVAQPAKLLARVETWFRHRSAA